MYKGRYFFGKVEVFLDTLIWCHVVKIRKECSQNKNKNDNIKKSQDKEIRWSDEYDE